MSLARAQACEQQADHLTRTTPSAVQQIIQLRQQAAQLYASAAESISDPTTRDTLLLLAEKQRNESDELALHAADDLPTGSTPQSDARHGQLARRQPQRRQLSVCSSYAVSLPKQICCSSGGEWTLP